jgi:hypothetical protein
MRLIGNFLSPYTRRVAVSLNLLELLYSVAVLGNMLSPPKCADFPMGVRGDARRQTTPKLRRYHLVKPAP